MRLEALAIEEEQRIAQEAANANTNADARIEADEEGSPPRERTSRFAVTETPIKSDLEAAMAEARIGQQVQDAAAATE